MLQPWVGDFVKTKVKYAKIGREAADFCRWDIFDFFLNEKIESPKKSFFNEMPKPLDNLYLVRDHAVIIHL